MERWADRAIQKALSWAFAGVLVASGAGAGALFFVAILFAAFALGCWVMDRA